MIHWFRRFAVVAAVVMAFCASSAQADPIISFSTVGTFATSGNSSLTKGDVTLNFTGVTLDIFAEDLNSNGVYQDDELFGYFNFDYGANWSAGDKELFAGEVFNLTITQTVPNPGTGGFNSSIVSGSIEFRTSTSGKSDLYLVFNDPLSITVPTSSTPQISYTIEKDVFIGDSNTASTEQFAVGGQAAVPLPGVVWGGMTLFGMVGGARGLNLLRRRVA
jgi:hypothetical protein